MVLTKEYGGDSNLPDAAHRYSPGHVIGIDTTVIRARPDPEKISTSYVERFNLSSRMQMRRFTRLSNGFSKKLESHRAAVALWVSFYNLCRVHETLRCTPAMALGVAESYLDDWRACTGRACAAGRAAVAAADAANNPATGIQAAQADCGTRREGDEYAAMTGDWRKVKI